MSRQKFPGWSLTEDYEAHSGAHGGFTGTFSPHCYQCVFGSGDPLQVEAEPATKPAAGSREVVPRRGCLYWVLACVVVLVAVGL